MTVIRVLSTRFYPQHIQHSRGVSVLYPGGQSETDLQPSNMVGVLETKKRRSPVQNLDESSCGIQGDYRLHVSAVYIQLPACTRELSP